MSFDEISQRWVHDAYITKPSDVPDVVYHYTDAAGLIGMMSSGTLWATDYRFLNDKSEFVHTRKIAEDQAAKHLKDRDDKVSVAFFAAICRYRNMEIPDDVFVFSMSEEADDLSQWRGYAREGQGFTIGLCGPTLNSALDTTARYSFFKVEYDSKRQNNAILKALKEIESELQTQVQKSPDDLKSLCSDAAREFDWVVEQRSAANKHKSFSAEREWRMLGYVTDAAKKSNIKVRSSGLHLVNYVEFNPHVSNTDLLPIVRIGIGPGFVESYEVHGVRALCRRFGYDPEIYFADSPYRRA